MATCADISTNGLLSLSLTTTGGSSYYACGFPSNYSTAASKCCNPNTIQPFSSDSCYSSCDLPASMNDQFLTDQVDYYKYFKQCLLPTGGATPPLWCRLGGPVVIPSRPTTTSAPTSTSTSTSTSAIEQFCAANDPQSLIAVNDPWPACGTHPNVTQHDDLEHCCSPSPVKWTVNHCLEYCYLPRGNQFRGLGNLTDDQILGSFQACLRGRGNASYDAFENLVCRTGGAPLDLKGMKYTTNKYLTGGGISAAARSWGVASWGSWTLLASALALGIRLIG